MNDANSVRPVMTRLKNIAARNECAVVLICHPNKNIFQSALYRTSGSTDWTAAPRVALYIGRDPEDEKTRVIAHTKANSIPENHQFSLKYSIDMDHGGIVFLGNSDLRADDVTCTKKTREKTTQGRPAESRDKAEEFLHNYLEENEGWALRSKIIAAGNNREIGSRALERAKKALHLYSFTQGFGKDRVTIWHVQGAKIPEQMSFHVN